MIQRATSTTCCAVELCPAFAVAGEPFCVAHRAAKKLAQVDTGEECRRCRRVLHVGDYVTLDSTRHQSRHAVCPKDRPKVAPRPKGLTPLLDGVPEAFDV